VRKAALHRGLPLVLTALPFLPTLAALAARPWPDLASASDAASLELYVRHVGHGAALVGPYSRFGWNHPGPAEFLALLPLYHLSGGRSASLALGTTLLNLLASLGCVLLLGRRGGTSLALAGAGLLAALTASFGPARLADPWNPFVTVLPCALLLVLSASCAANGPARALPALAAVATFLVQSHVAYVPLAGATVVGALALRLARRPREPVSRPAAASAALVTAILWAPPLVEELRGDPGNLTKLAGFFARPERAHTFAEAFGAALRPLGTVPLSLATLVVPSTSDQRAVGAGFATLALVALLPLAASRARSSPFARALATLSALSLAVALWSFLRVRGPLLDYLVGFASALGLAGCVALVAPLPGLDRRWACRALAAGSAAVALLSLRANARRVAVEPPMGLATVEPVARLSLAARSWLRAGGVRRPLLRIGSHDTWPLALGLGLALHKAAVPFAVEPGWVVMFGPPLAPTGGEDAALVLGDLELAAAFDGRPDAVEIARDGDAVLFGVRDPGYLARAVWSGETAARGHGVAGDPAGVARGRLPREGSRWDAPFAVVLPGPDAWVEVDAPPGVAVAGLLVSADDNDTYTVSASRDGAAFEEIGVLPRATGGGLRRRPFFSRRLAGCRTVRLAPRAGDGSYSIGAVRFLVVPVTGRGAAG